MKFSKLQATGNDFVLVDARNMERTWTRLARDMCDRRFGIGADGLIIVQHSTVADLKLRLFNSDGSEAEVSGNGLRCFVKYVVDRGLAGRVRSQARQSSVFLTIETLSGVRKAKAYLSPSGVRRAEVNMGLPRFRPGQIPVKVKRAAVPILNYPLAIDGTELSLCILSMGNPHAVAFLSQPVADFPLAYIGPKVEQHPMFPRRTNFEAARVLGKGKIEARVWERGVGETLACGSGASAIAVAARLLGYVGGLIDIIFPGGVLAVRWDGAGEVLLRGPVQEVFVGDWPEGRS